MSINQDIRYSNEGTANNPHAFYDSILSLKAGMSMLKGASVPLVTVGTDGDVYTDTTSNIQYIKKGGAWEEYINLSAGSVASGANLGGEGIYDSTDLNGVMYFKGLTAGSNISLVGSATDITINASSTGEVNTASNVGLVGSGIFKQKVLQDLQFRKLTTSYPDRLSIVQGVDSVSLDVANFILGGFNSGLPAAAQVYSGVGVGQNLIFKPLYSSTPNLLNVDYSMDNQNIVFGVKSTEQYSCYVSGIGSANSVLFWNHALSPAVMSAFTLSDSSDKKIVKLCGKVLFNADWSYTAGSITIEIGHIPSASYMNPAAFVPLVSTGLSLAAVNQSIVWNAGVINYIVPALSSLTCRVTNVGVTSTSILADLMLTVHIQDI